MRVWVWQMLDIPKNWWIFIDNMNEYDSDCEDELPLYHRKTGQHKYLKSALK